MAKQLKGVLVVGSVLVIVAVGAAFTKRKVEDDAYYNQHLKAAHSTFGERYAKAIELALPLESSDFAVTWGEGEDMWPLLNKLRDDMTATKMWATAANYPSSNFVFSIAAQEMPDLTARLEALKNCTRCYSITNIDKGALLDHKATSTAKGVTRILMAKADQEMSREQWKEAEATLMLADHVSRVAATGPNRDGLLTWSGNQLSLQRKMLITISKGQLEPDRLSLFRNYLYNATSMPDMKPAVNLEYFTLYWFAKNIDKVTEDERILITAFSPSEDSEPPRHPAVPDSLASVVLEGWFSALSSFEAYPNNPAYIGRAVDKPLFIAAERESVTDYVIETLDPVFEQTGMMLGRALETRILALAVIDTVTAEKQGKPLPDIAAFKPPQDEFGGRKFKRIPTSDGWVIALEDTKNPADLPYGLTDRIPDNILAFRWKSTN